MDDKNVSRLIEEFKLQRLKDDERFNKLFDTMQEQNKQASSRAEQATEMLAKVLGDKENVKLLTSSAAPHPAILIQALGSTVSEFHYIPDSVETFAVWYARHESVFESAATLTDVERVNFLLSRIHGIDRDKYVNDILPDKSASKTFEQTVEHLTKLFGRNESQYAIRQKCFKMHKSELEDYATFAGKVKKSVCEFKIGELRSQDLLCLVFIEGLQEPKDLDLKQRLIQEVERSSDTTVDMLTAMCVRAENLKKEVAKTPFKEEVLLVNHKPWSSNKAAEPKHFRQQPSTERTPPGPCWLCGKLHWVQDCPYRDRKCPDCLQKGHKSGFCGKRRTTRTSLAITLRAVTRQHGRHYVRTEFNGVGAKLQLDTASDITIISLETWRRFGEPQIKQVKEKVNSASQHAVKILGTIEGEIKIGSRVLRGNIFVTDLPLNLLGIDLLDAFQLWDTPINQISSLALDNHDSIIRRIMDKYKDVFRDELGKCTKGLIHLQLKENAAPVMRPKRNPSLSTQGKIEAELERLQAAGIITPVDFSSYGAPIVAVRKPNGKIRICGDYSTGLNDVLESHAFPLPLPKDLFNKCGRSVYYTHFDVSDAYLQCEVDEVSKEILTINTHRGLFKVNRLQPGVKSAPGAFQQLMETMLAGLDCAEAYLDDILVFGKTVEEHTQNVEKVLQRIREFGFTLKKTKCNFFKTELTYLGRVVSAAGTKPDPLKVEAVLKMTSPKNISELRSYLGAVSYYMEYIPNMRKLRDPLDKLLQKGSEWKWTSNCQQSFEDFKKALINITQLAHYDPSVPITVAADASNAGLGGTLYHTFSDGSRKPISHASRALTPAEKNYSQVEKEGLALIFAVKKFHRYIYGRKFTLETDHKPLLGIFGSKKGVPGYTANRLQRWAIILMNYDFNINYTSTLEFGHADVLSRLIKQTPMPDEDYVISCVKCDGDVMEESLQQLPLKYEDIKRATLKCEDLKLVMRFLKEGWPDKKDVLKHHPKICKFSARRDELQEIDECLFYGERIVLPVPLQQKVLKQLHEGHPGISRMTQLARSYVYWPNIDEHIKEFVQSCASCISYAKAPTKTLLESWPKPTTPWYRLHIDYAGPVHGLWYLVIVDAYSKWLEVFQTTTTTTQNTIECLRETFARFGVPMELVSDNGTQFTSSSFKKFCLDNGIKHLTTAPYHPQSNGQAERFVDTLKRTMNKLKGSGDTVAQDLQTFLRTYRSTPSAATPSGKSPAEEFLGRPVRTTLDLMKNSNHPLMSTNHKQNNQFNRKHGAKLRDFEIGEQVSAICYRDNKSFWASGIITRRIGKVNYEVRLDHGRTSRYHANQLRSRFSQATPNLDLLFQKFDLPVPTIDDLDSPTQHTIQNDMEPIEMPQDDELQEPATPPQGRRTRSGRRIYTPVRWSPT